MIRSKSWSHKAYGTIFVEDLEIDPNHLYVNFKADCDCTWIHEGSSYWEPGADEIEDLKIQITDIDYYDGDGEDVTVDPSKEKEIEKILIEYVEDHEEDIDFDIDYNDYYEMDERGDDEDYYLH